MVTRDNYGAKWNGIGAVGGVLNKDADAPMVYRVLVPWLMNGLRLLKFPMLEAYELLKILFTWGALVSVHLVWGWGVALFVAILLPATFQYDYWDWAPELMGLSLVMTGRFELAIIGVIVWGLSKETAWLGFLAYGLLSYDISGSVILLVVTGLIYLVLRLVQGEHKLYCDRVMLRSNLQVLFEIKEQRPAWLSSMFFAVLISIAAICVGFVTFPKGIIPVGFVFAGWVFAKADEIRVFTAVLPWIGWLLVQVV